MKINNVSINILIKGRAATEFVSPLDFQNYIEGRDGSEFEVELVNDNPFDVEAVVSIDGLSIIDGKPAGSASSGYLVRGRGRMTIPGWKVDGGTAAKFQFSGSKGDSYVEQIGGDALNKGVIGLRAYAPRHAPRPTMMAFNSVSKSAFGSHTKSFGAARSAGSSADGHERSRGISSASLSASSVQMNNAVGSNAYTPDSFDMTQSMDEPTQTLGTQFGDATAFKTVTVDFTRGDLQAMVELFYDDRQGLKRRGIDVTRTATRPSAFPADEAGCAPPANWSR